MKQLTIPTNIGNGKIIHMQYNVHEKTDMKSYVANFEKILAALYQSAVYCNKTYNTPIGELWR